jgi:hypothetical protein
VIKPLLVAICLWILPVTSSLARGQAAPGPDSLAAAARNLYRQAVRTAEGGHLAEARELSIQAHRSWPGQIAYLSATLRLSARLGDTVGVAHWLGAIADLGLSIPIESVTELAALAAAPALGPVLDRIRENSRALGNSTAIRTDLAADFYPEGVDYDPKGKRWIVASIRHRTLAAVDARGTSTPFLTKGGRALDAVLGVRVDAARNVVWATTRTLPQQQGAITGAAATAGVAVFDRATGRELAFTVVPNDGAGHLFGDLVIDGAGAAYLSDSESPVIYRAKFVAGRVTIEEFTRHRYFRSLQGLAIDPTGRRLYAADYSHGLLAVDLADRSVRYLPSPAGTTTLGLDGLAWYRGGLVGVQNGVAPARIVRIALSSDGDAITAVTVLDRHASIADEPTIGSIVGDRFVYVANSQWEKYDDAGKLRDGARLTAPILLSLPLGSIRP